MEVVLLLGVLLLTDTALLLDALLKMLTHLPRR